MTGGSKENGDPVILSMNVFVYGLIDPRTGLVRYVGKTVHGISRVREHGQPWRRRLNDRCAKWLSSLHRLGLTFEFCALEYCTTGSVAEAERWWIAYGRASGWPLTNLTDGGDGALGRHPSEATLAKMRANCGHPMGTAQREALAARMRGNTHTKGLRHTDEARQKMSTAHRHRPKTKQHIEAIRRAVVAVKRSWTDDQLVDAVSRSTSPMEVGRHLRISKTSTYRLRRDIERLGLATQHFKGGGWPGGGR